MEGYLHRERGALLLPLLENNNAKAEVVPKDDPRLYTEHMKYPGATGEVLAYLARPKGDAKIPGVGVIHENRGLVPHIEDVTRRVALEGFLAIAPDALTPLGGTPEDPEKAPAHGLEGCQRAEGSSRNDRRSRRGCRAQR